MTDQEPEPADPPVVDVETEGDDDDHVVPADLTVLHEIIEYDALTRLGPNS